MRPFVRAAAAGLAVACVLLVSSCTATGAADMSSHDLLGETLEDARPSFPDDATVLIQDASPRLGLSASYRDELNDGRWTVVSACSSDDLLADSDLIEVAVIPTNSFTSAVDRRMEEGEFRDAVTSCEG